MNIPKATLLAHVGREHALPNLLGAAWNHIKRPSCQRQAGLDSSSMPYSSTQPDCSTDRQLGSSTDVRSFVTKLLIHQVDPFPEI